VDADTLVIGAGIAAITTAPVDRIQVEKDKAGRTPKQMLFSIKRP